MPAYNFMQIWEPKILDRSKFTTIRRRRKRQTRPGDVLALYVGQRTKSCRLVGRAPCVKVTPIVIYPFEMNLKLEGALMTVGKSLEVARRDGFKDLASFYEFFQRYERAALEDFEIIQWDPRKLEVGDDRN